MDEGDRVYFHRIFPSVVDRTLFLSKTILVYFWEITCSQVHILSATQPISIDPMLIYHAPRPDSAQDRLSRLQSSITTSKFNHTHPFF